MTDLLIDLFLTFVKLALFNFGGGFALIPLIAHELEGNQWLTIAEFSNVIAISQVTPGAVAINTATYVGYRVAGVWGGLVASLAIPVPSFIIVGLLSPVLLKYKDHTLNRMIFYGIRPVVVGLIINASVTVARDPFFKESALSLNRWFNQLPDWFSTFNLVSLMIFLLSLFLVFKTKINPILIMVISGFLSMVIFHFI